MKRWVLRFRKKDRNDFLDVKKGLKTVETRAATLKYRGIKKGDILIFVCGKERLEKKVKKAEIFSSIKKMIKEVPLKKIMPNVSSEKELEKICYGYSGYRNKIKKFGLVAFDIGK